jgi:hypothetical protein
VDGGKASNPQGFNVLSIGYKEGKELGVPMYLTYVEINLQGSLLGAL